VQTSESTVRENRGVSYRLGLATRQVVAGDWRRAVDTLRLAAWLGRCVGFTVGFAAPYIGLTAFLAARGNLPIRSIPVTLLIWSALSIIALPLAVCFGNQLLKPFGFALRATTLRGGMVEGVVLGITFCIVSGIYLCRGR
jgi:hypothetical protein